MLVTEVFITSITLRAYMGSRKWTMPSIFSKAFNIISFSSYPRVGGTECNVAKNQNFYMYYCSCYFACYNKNGLRASKRSMYCFSKNRWLRY